MSNLEPTTRIRTNPTTPQHRAQSVSIEDNRAQDLRRATDLILEERDLRIRLKVNQSSQNLFSQKGIREAALLEELREFLSGKLKRPRSSPTETLVQVFGQESGDQAELLSPVQPPEKKARREDPAPPTPLESKGAETSKPEKPTKSALRRLKARQKATQAKEAAQKTQATPETEVPTELATQLEN